jgi:hypothetical protein
MKDNKWLRLLTYVTVSVNQELLLHPLSYSRQTAALPRDGCFS